MTKFKVKSLADSDFHLPDILGREFREKTEDIYGISMNNFEFGDQAQRCDANQPNLFTDVLLLRNNEPVKDKKPVSECYFTQAEKFCFCLKPEPITTSIPPTTPLVTPTFYLPAVGITINSDVDNHSE